MNNLLPHFLITVLITIGFSAQSQDRVVGGSEVLPGDYPWMCSIVMADGSQGCGASLIRPNWVLTAAHCDLSIFSSDLAADKVIINSLITTSPYSPGAELHEVLTFIGHEDYSFSDFSGPDIALIMLSTPSDQEPVSLATTDDESLYAEGMPVSAMGWGLMESGVGSSVLLKGDCSVLSYDTCDYMSGFYNLNEGGNICAGYFVGEDMGGAASGDSGGPLFFTDGGEIKQVGIVSGGDIEMTTESSPGVYTLVPEYIEWIDSVITDFEESIAGVVENTPTLSPVVRQLDNKLLEISNLKNTPHELKLIDMSGKTVMSLSGSDPTIILNCQGAESGMYFIHLQDVATQEVFRTKIVVAD